ncbi:uncharacterized protein EI97DRAFT_431811 [Westerdykella ornata]|uniref:Uncharacterized protein n=1 Tax=Westerdykella ornata TaxID=318751 RepID=A0A6A6JNL5_WESOR|nr:uncharacterized protein EI97DRAFT_431811 [Westerdykella ornata]KAF2277723.1 hypothetical protein EI97DRAFT_431811 [Westerdykella ornata]
MPGPPLTLDILKSLDSTFWANESHVNGVWNVFFNFYFEGDKFIVCPESTLDDADSRLRGDLDIIQINSPRDPVKPLSIALSYEGKREGAGRATVDAVVGQLQKYATNAYKTQKGANFFCIAAEGTTFRLFVKSSADSLVGLNMRMGGGKPTVASNTGGATAATTYDLLNAENYRDICGALEYIRDHTFPLDTDY